MLMCLCAQPLSSKIVKGRIKDAVTNEDIIGAVIRSRDNRALCTVSGLDGSFVLSVDDESELCLCCSSVGYQSVEVSVEDGNEPLVVLMESADKLLEEVTVTASACGNTEAKAREIEKTSLGVVKW